MTSSNPIRVLAVDDEEGPLFTLEMILSDAGYEVTAVSNPKQVLEILRSATFDLMVTDRNMPGLPGDELVLAVKAHFPNLRILMLTGTGRQMLAESRMPYGVDRVLGKPVTKAELLAAMDLLVHGVGLRV